MTGLDEEEVTFEGVSAKTFFDLILENTIEGFFADPIYGGNRDMVGWQYVGFPGRALRLPRLSQPWRRPPGSGASEPDGPAWMVPPMN